MALPTQGLTLPHESERTTKDTKSTKEWNELSNCVIGSAIEVSRFLNPGISESANVPLRVHQHKGGIQLHIWDPFVLFVSFVVI
jgi:hypothetical protein